MPWSKKSDVPKNLSALDGVSLTLEQANGIAEQADAMEKDGNKYAWPTAIKIFKKSHEIRDNAWVKREDTKKEAESDIIISKEDNGAYWITAVSTAAVRDAEGETFDVRCMDYDIEQARLHNDYPEFRVFHSPVLGIGKVTKMQRVGIFAVDSGPSYTDPFSLEVCEKMLSNNDGKWRTSRGFKAEEVSGSCPTCREGLVVRQKQMIAGFRCPSCRTIHLTYKGVLDDVHFRKARTFDVTATDRPCVPFTGMSANKLSELMEESTMTKKELRKRLIDAGLDAAAVDERLKSVDDARLKELGDIPDAVLLKEMDMEDMMDQGADEDEEDANGNPKSKSTKKEQPEDSQVFVLDPEVLKDFTKIVRKEVETVLDGLSIDLQGTDLELKEVPGVQELRDEVAELKELVLQLLEKDEDRLKDMLKEAPRAGKLRIMRHVPESDDDEGDGEYQPSPVEKSVNRRKQAPSGVVVGSDGTEFPSMTDFLVGGEK